MLFSVAIQKGFPAVSTTSKYKISQTVFSQHLNCTLQIVEGLYICHNIGEKGVFQYFSQIVSKCDNCLLNEIKVCLSKVNISVTLPKIRTEFLQYLGVYSSILHSTLTLQQHPGHHHTSLFEVFLCFLCPFRCCHVTGNQCPVLTKHFSSFLGFHKLQLQFPGIPDSDQTFKFVCYED